MKVKCKIKVAINEQRVPASLLTANNFNKIWIIQNILKYNVFAV